MFMRLLIRQTTISVRFVGAVREPPSCRYPAGRFTNRPYANRKSKRMHLSAAFVATRTDLKIEHAFKNKTMSFRSEARNLSGGGPRIVFSSRKISPSGRNDNYARQTHQ